MSFFLSLRRALRLVHFLQKERGASCAVLASSPGNGGFVLALQQARDATDVAARRLYRDIPMALNRIRKQIDEQTSQVHRMLVIYNTLISKVEHEYVSIHLRKSSSGQRQTSNPRPQLRYQRSKSTNDFQDCEKETIVSMTDMKKRRKQTSDTSHTNLYSSSSMDGRVSLPSSSVEFIKPCSDPSLWMPSIRSSIGRSSPIGHNTARASPTLVPSPQSRRNGRQSQDSSATPPDHHPHAGGGEDRTLSILNLLKYLVCLKESTGMQRAIMSCMSAGRQHQDSPSQQHMLLTSLLLEVENQRRLVAEVDQLPLFDYSLQKLVQDSVVMTGKLESLQEKITHDFDLQGFHVGIDSYDIWNMITVYVDKLYAVEMLLVEELEYCAEIEHEMDLKQSTSIQPEEDALLSRIFGKQATNVVEMPANDVKQRLVEFMGRNVKRQEPDQPNPPLLRDPDRPLRETQSESLLSELMHKATVEEPSKEWQISLDEIIFRKRIGRGSAGTTYLATWSGQTVAVKVAALSDAGLEGWTSEVQSLQRLHHPNVIRLLGSVYNSNPLTYCLVLEYCNAGDLSSAMQRPTPRNFFMRVATDVANGMAYLHKRGVLHRDIKPSNVLLDGSVQNGTFAAKVSDLGVATSYFEETDGNLTAETGTYRWMAPEIIRHEPYSLMADVYSYAILLWQLLTRESPFHNVSPLEAAGKVALELARPPFPECTPMAIQDLIRTSWAEDPSMRLTFQDISKRIQELQLTEDERMWLQAPMGHAVYNAVPERKTTISSPSSTTLQVPLQGSSKPPSLNDNDNRKQREKRASGFRRIFPKHMK